MGLFGKSFDQKVREAVAAVNRAGLGVHDLRATVEGKVVTLEGRAETIDAKGRAAAEFNALVATENTINRIRVEAPASAPLPGPAPAAPAAGDVTIYEVQPGDTLGALAQRFYGQASLYPKIFQANRDVLSDPNLIKAGQKLKIPK